MATDNKKFKLKDLLKGNSEESSTQTDIYAAQDFFNLGIVPSKIPTKTGLCNNEPPHNPLQTLPQSILDTLG
jgi:hypothetical protein